jgi:hypothetical protein
MVAYGWRLVVNPVKLSTTRDDNESALRRTYVRTYARTHEEQTERVQESGKLMSIVCCRVVLLRVAGSFC